MYLGFSELPWGLASVVAWSPCGNCAARSAIWCACAYPGVISVLNQRHDWTPGRCRMHWRTLRLMSCPYRFQMKVSCGLFVMWMTSSVKPWLWSSRRLASEPLTVNSHQNWFKTFKVSSMTRLSDWFLPLRSCQRLQSSWTSSTWLSDSKYSFRLEIDLSISRYLSVFSLSMPIRDDISQYIPLRNASENDLSDQNDDIVYEVAISVFQELRCSRCCDSNGTRRYYWTKYPRPSLCFSRCIWLVSQLDRISSEMSGLLLYRSEYNCQGHRWSGTPWYRPRCYREDGGSNEQPW